MSVSAGLQTFNCMLVLGILVDDCKSLVAGELEGKFLHISNIRLRLPLASSITETTVRNVSESTSHIQMLISAGGHQGPEYDQ